MLDRCDVGASPLPPLMAAAHPPRTHALLDPYQALRSGQKKCSVSGSGSVCSGGRRGGGIGSGSGSEGGSRFRV